MKVNLLPHNQEAYEKIQKVIADGKKKISVSHATGTGKSYLITKLFEDYSNDKKLVLVPSTYISDQMQKLFQKYSIQNADIILYQKLIKMTDEDIAAMDYSVIALDEYHHDTSKVWGMKVKTLIDTHSNSIIFGTSATPVRTDGVNTIDELFEGNCASDLPLSESIAKKIVPLPKYVGALYRLDDELEKLRKKVENATNTKEEKDELYKKINVMRSQIEKSYGMPIILNKNIKDREGKYIVFCKNKKHLREIKDTVIGWFRTAGCKSINAYELYSDYENKDADYNAFCEDTSHSLHLLFCVDMLNEGLHLKNISGVLLLRPTRSGIVWHQQIGRAIEANNTNTPVIIDAVNNFRFARQGMKLFKEIRGAVEKEKKSNPNFDDSGFEDIDTFFVLEQVVEIQEMFKEIETELTGREWTVEEIEILKKWYPIEGIKVEKRLNGRSREAIYTRVKIIGLKVRKEWTKEEIKILKQYYPIEGMKIVNRFVGRTTGAIKLQVKKLGLKAPNKKWTEKEIEILKKWYPIEGTEVSKRLNNRSLLSIMTKCSELKIKAPDTNWTKEEDDILRLYYPKYGRKTINYLPHRPISSISDRANSLGLYVEKRSIFSREEDAIIKKYYPEEGNEVYKRLQGKTEKQCRSRAKYLGVKRDNKWSQEEERILKRYYPLEGSKVEKRLKRWNKKQIYSKVMELGVKKKRNYDDIDKLKELLLVESNLNHVAREMGCGIQKLKFLIEQYGLTCNKPEKLSKYKYVTLDKRRGKYKVCIKIDGKLKNFGCFDNEDEAGKVAMEKAKEYGKAI